MARIPLGVATHPGRGGIEIGHHLRIRYFAHHLGQNLVDVAHFGNVALTREQFRRNGQVAELGQPAAHIPDVLVHPENLLHHQYHRELATLGRLCEVGRDFAVRHRDFHLARQQVGAVGGDGLGGDGAHREREPARQQGDDELAPGQRRGGGTFHAVDYTAISRGVNHRPAHKTKRRRHGILQA